MQDKTENLLILLLVTTLFKGLFWSASVPAWQIPDEQAHFAQVQYYAETRHGINTDYDLSQEVAKSLMLLGTYRDERGNNKFTYHPEYKIEYSDNLIGPFEPEITSQDKTSRSVFVKREAARYPPIFYLLSAIGYLSVYQGDLILRLYFTRFISIIFAMLTVAAAYLLTNSVFPKNKLLAISIAALVSWQPMFSFLSSGVNNDNLLNLFSAILLWVMVDGLVNGITQAKIGIMGVTLGLGIITKQLIYPFIPLPFLLIVYDSLIRKQNFKLFFRLFLPLSAVTLLSGGLLFARQWYISGTLPFWPQVNQTSPGYSLTIIEYLSAKLPQLYRETLPWYWGVFKWLGVVLPLAVLRIIKVSLVLSAIGFARYLVKKISLRNFTSQDLQLAFLLFVSIFYAASLLFWDYMLIRSIGFSHGIQGRNFFPVLVPHMTILAFGIWNLCERQRVRILKFFTIAMVVLNFLALVRVMEIYYTVFPFSLLILQISQYKPWFFKGIGIVIWFVVYITVLFKFLKKYLLLKDKRK